MYISGYLRIFLVILSCFWMFTDPLKAAACFSVSHTILDDLDGIAARRFKQGELKIESRKEKFLCAHRLIDSVLTKGEG